MVPADTIPHVGAQYHTRQTLRYRHTIRHHHDRAVHPVRRDVRPHAIAHSSQRLFTAIHSSLHILRPRVYLSPARTFALSSTWAFHAATYCSQTCRSTHAHRLSCIVVACMVRVDYASILRHQRIHDLHAHATAFHKISTAH